MSINATLMYASKRTYPEISFPVVCLSSRYNRATEDDYAKALRVAEYTMGCGDKHGLILSPKSLQLVAKLMNFEPLLLYSSGGRLVSVTCRVLARR